MSLPNPLTGKKSKWKWSEKKGLYIYKSSGQAVKFSVIKSAFEKVIAVSSGRMEALTAQLIGKRISLAAWQLGMSVQVKLLHMSSAAAARGGWTRMSPADWKYANSLAKNQMKYLKNFAKQIRTKKQPLDGRALSRTRMYAEAGRSTFEQVRRRFEAVSNGKKEEKRELGAADHCKDCVRYANMGWQPIGTLPPIGQSICLTKCHCKFVYR